MLSQRILNIIKLSRNTAYQALNTQPLTSSATVLNHNENSNIPGQPDAARERRKAEARKFVLEESGNPLHGILSAEIELTPWGLKKYIGEKKVKLKKYKQRFSPTRVDYLGPDLAIAHFIIYEGGKVKFKGSDEWVQLNEDKITADMPNNYNPTYIVTAIDASGIELYYEALENFRNVPKVNHINFARSPFFDDWFMDKLTAMFPNLEYLDVSDCPRLSERGLEALYKCPKLKTLTVTNNYKSAAFELTCMMLEDLYPELKIKIINPKEKLEPIINQ